MNIDEAIELLNSIVKVNKHLLQGIENQTINQDEIQAIETIINEYSNLKQIEEAHRIENGKLREEIKDLEETLDNTWSGFKGIQEDLTNQLKNTPPVEYY